MTLSFAGVGLLLEDIDNHANEHIRRYLDERLASIFTPKLTAYCDSREVARLNNSQSSIQQVGLPVPTYPDQLRPRINTLFWPTGATRFAQGLFLINGANLAAIIATMTSSGGLVSNTAQTFVMETPELQTGVSTPMYLLPPRPVSGANIPANDRLWILPLVDERYFWQYRQVSTFSPQTWSSLFSSIATAIGTTISVDSVSSAYGIPDPTEWTRSYENVAMLLDAAAATIGKRFVRDWSFSSPDTTVNHVVGAATATLGLAVELAGATDTVAGGDFSTMAVASVTPASVTVAFRNATNSAIGNVITVSAPSTPNDSTQSKIFHTTFQDYGRVVATSAQSLANQASSDYYSWLAKRYDIDFTGICSWHPIGFDDFILWEYGVKKGEQKEYLAQTRVQSLPYNVGITNLPVQPTPTSSSSSSSVSSQSSSSSSSVSSQSQSSASGSASGSGTSASGSASGSGTSASGSASSSSGCGCVTVVTNVACSGGSLVVTYGQARGCC